MKLRMLRRQDAKYVRKLGMLLANLYPSPPTPLPRKRGEGRNGGSPRTSSRVTLTTFFPFNFQLLTFNSFLRAFAPLRLCVSFLVLLFSLSIAFAQDDTGAWVTTQDYASLRAGPGMNFERLAVVPPAVTLPVIGRTPTGRWIQVEYEGHRGWIIYWLLVWSGDLASAHLDGVDPAPFIRLGVTGVIQEDTQLFDRRFLPIEQTIPAGTVVEITGRQGTGLYIWMQINYQGEYYWVRSWEIEDDGGVYTTLFDVSYLNPYSRFVTGFSRDISDATASLGRIESIWERLVIGESVSCGSVPDYATRRLSRSDVNRMQRFAPLVAALDNAIVDINAAISAFADACAREGERLFITEQEVRAALEQLNRARRNLVLARSLLNTL